jgi:TatD DNase family protein
MIFTDAHCHFMDLPSSEEAAQKALRNGVTRIVSNGVDLKSNIRNQELARQFPVILPSFGLHPKECLEQTESKNQKTIEWMEQQLKSNRAAAVGETGLDFSLAKTSEQRERQKKWFQQQLEMGKQFNRTVSIHSREALHETIRMVLENENKQALFHWFDGNAEQLETVCQNGFFVSIGPAVFSQKKIQEIGQCVELENLVLETDCPVKFNGQASEPSWIPEIAKKMAELRKEPLEKIAEKTTVNAQKLFPAKTGF